MKVLVVDSNSVLSRTFYGIKLLSNKNGDFTNAVYGFLNILIKMLEELSPDIVVFAFDLKAKTFRHEMFADYKANRSATPEELISQFPLTKEIITALGYPILELEGYEADDIIGTIASMCREHNHECVIATGDRDSFQLAHDGVSVRLTTTKMGASKTEIINSEKITQDYGISPQQLIYVKALMGDKSDNIPGVAGVGEKTALELIQNFGDLDKVYENIDDDRIKKGVRQKLIDKKDSAYMSLKLAIINQQVPLGITIDKLKPLPRNNSELLCVLTRLELHTIIKRLGLDGQQKQISNKENFLIQCEPVNFDNQFIEKLLNQDRIYLSMEFLGRNPLSFAVCYTENEKTIVSFLDNQSENFTASLKQILTSNSKICCDSSKELYYYSFSNNFEITNIDFDITIGGYIINPLATEYTSERLSFYYSITPPLICPTQHENNVCTYYKIRQQILDELASQEQLSLLYDIEMPLSKVLASMEYWGFALDSKKLTVYGQQLDKELAEISDTIFLYSGEKFNINSPKQVGSILFDKLELPKRKKTKSGYSTDVDVLESLKNKHPIISFILEYRKLSKLRSTYVLGLLNLVADDGRVHTIFKQTETRTGRISSTEPNMQNIPIRTERGSRLREFFIAQSDTVLVDADYSQIELRVLAHISNDPQMIEAFNNNMDIHTKTAAEVFDLPEDFVTPIMRTRAKAVNFGIVYGIGAFSLSQDIGVKVSEADHYIKSYLETYRGVKKYMEDTISFAETNGYVQTMFNRRRLIPEVTVSNKIIRASGERIAMNTPIQGSAADIIKIAMIKVYNRIKKEQLKSKLILQVHDELIVEATKDEAEIVKNILTEEMSSAVSLSVPLVCDAHIGDNWLSAK